MASGGNFRKDWNKSQKFYGLTTVVYTLYNFGKSTVILNTLLETPKIYWNVAKPPGKIFWWTNVFIILFTDCPSTCSHNLHRISTTLDDRGVRIETRVLQLLRNLNLQSRPQIFTGCKLSKCTVPNECSQKLQGIFLKFLLEVYRKFVETTRVKYAAELERQRRFVTSCTAHNSHLRTHLPFWP